LSVDAPEKKICMNYRMNCCVNCGKEMRYRWETKNWICDDCQVSQDAPPPPPDKSVTEDHYFTILDSYARFYNSQTTAHIGYLISIFALTVGSLVGIVVSTILRADTYYPDVMGLDTVIRWGVLTGAIVVFLLWVLMDNFPFPYFSLKYRLGRIQYWMALSQIVWEHMGGKSNPKEDFMLRLKKRVFEQEIGVEQAISTLFEARLYVSGCTRQREKRQIMETPEVLRLQDDKLKKYFMIGKDIPVSGGPYLRKTVIFYHLDQLLYLAYKKQIAGERGQLLRQAFEE